MTPIEFSMIIDHIILQARHCNIFGLIRGGVRLRSSLSAEEAQNQRLCSGAEIDVNFINSYILSAYYMKSYKKCRQKAQYLEIT